MGNGKCLGSGIFMLKVDNYIYIRVFKITKIKALHLILHI